MALASQNLLTYVKVPAGTPLAASSAGGAQANSPTITASAGKTAYVQRFTITGSGATAAANIAVTLADGTNTLSYQIAVPAGATTAITALDIQFDPPLPAATTGATWTLTCPSFGTGNTSCAASLIGFQV